MAAHRHRPPADHRQNGAGSAAPAAHRADENWADENWADENRADGRNGEAPGLAAPRPEAEADRDCEKKFTLRLPASLLAEIERDAKSRPDKISINSWLIGAALQRLEKRHDDGEMAA